ncbi:vicilin-like seed storage protein At2g18540 [Diprion similis]|uniref:vicilin-like seed storage protein At2g18540 n=1 Tax=Diprion similis TaxID=362088 RepID=UPI001EF81984|nr:vicilin-like seed storage protein At2g18540 [Diprion similis]
MADDSDIDSWYLRKDEIVQTSHKNLRSKFNDPGHNGIRLSNGYSTASHRSRAGEQKSSGSSTEVRFINPAIYAESLTPSNGFTESVETPCSTSTDEEATVVVEVRCGDSNGLADGFSTLSVNENSPSIGDGDAPSDQVDLGAADTYRCGSESDTSRTSTLTLTNNSKSVTRLVRRCVIDGSSKIYDEGDTAVDQEDVHRFSTNCRRVVQFSSSSLSSSAFSDSRTSGLDLARRIAHQEWVQKKQRAALQKSEAERKAELRRRQKEERAERERLERERNERDNFLKWQERKKKEEADRKQAVEQELELQRRLKAVEDRAAIAKIIHLQQWARKKEVAQKAQQKEQELKQKAIEEDRKKRLAESSQAFEKWRESAKSRPRPATQGLLPHQRAKPSYVNPKPWQQIVDVEESESQEDLLRKKSAVQGKQKGNIVRRSIASHH